MTRRPLRRLVRLATTLGLALLAMSSFLVDSAHACSGTVCRAAAVFPAGGDIPRDQAVFTLHQASLSSNDDAGVPMPRLSRLDGDVRTEVPFTLTRVVDVSVSYEVTFELKPSVELAPSTKLLLELEGPSCEPTKKLEARFTIVDAAQTPAALGALRVAQRRARLEVATRAGSCSVERDVAYADLTVELAPSALPFAEVLAYEWVVDGAKYTGFSSSLFPAPDDVPLPRGTERVYAPCEKDEHLIDDLTSGTHRVFLRGKLRSGATVATPEVSFELRCDAGDRAPDASIGAADAGLRGDTGLPGDAGSSADAARPAPNTSPSLPSDAGGVGTTTGRADVGGTGPVNEASNGDDGCALTSRGESKQTYALWLGVFATVFFASRRRR